MSYNGGAGQANGAYDRFRSFAERYLIARAETFEPGKELEQGWQTIMDAKKLYQMMARASVDEAPDEARNATQAGAQQAAQQAYGHIIPNTPRAFLPSTSSEVQLKQALDLANDLAKHGSPVPGIFKSMISHLLTQVGLAKYNAGARNNAKIGKITYRR